MKGYVNLTHTNNGKIEAAKQELRQYVDSHSGAINTISVNGVQQEIDENKNVDIDVPVKTSDLNNDSGFITNTVNNLTNYYKKTETYTQSEVNALILAIKTISVQFVDVLPTASAETYFNTSKTIYMVRNASTGGSNYYDEYITIRTGEEGSYVYTWENIGSTQIDLSGYVPTSRTIAGIDLVDNITTSELRTALNVEDGAEVNIINSISTPKDTLTPDANRNIKIPYARYLQPGLVEILVGGGYGIDYLYGTPLEGGSSALMIKRATNENIDTINGQNPDVYHPIVPANLKYALSKAVLTGNAAPTTSTDAYFVGQLYKDTANNKLYICDAITEDTSTTPSTFTYTWTQLIRATDYASDLQTGVMKTDPAFGSKILQTGVHIGKFMIAGASSTNIDNRAENLTPEYSAGNNTCKPIMPATLNYAVKAALTDTNKVSLTDAEKTSALDTLGIRIGIGGMDE